LVVSSRDVARAIGRQRDSPASPTPNAVKCPTSYQDIDIVIVGGSDSAII
jgi:hypothetical protein